MVHQARSVLERSKSRSNERSKKRNKNGHEVAGDRYQVEKKEHGAADDLDLSIDFGEPDSSPTEDPTEWFAKMKKAGHGRRRDDRESCAGISPLWTWTWLLTGSRQFSSSECTSNGTRHLDFRVKDRTTLQKGGDARPRQTMARACAASHTFGRTRVICMYLVSLRVEKHA